MKNSTVKNEYQYLDKKDEELKSANITVENESIVEYGNDFINCKIIQCKQNASSIFHQNITKSIIYSNFLHVDIFNIVFLYSYKNLKVIVFNFI